METSLPSVAEFFHGRNVFITGPLGFLGKVLVEKLLRSCPNIGKIYLLIREKRGKDALQRLQTALELPVFDRLKREQPHALEKLVAVPGDMMSLGLAMSANHRAELEEKVSVVFNVAATVRFDDTLKNAVLMNVRGTREVLDIASKMKQLKVFLHVSTTYCNTQVKNIAERIYPPNGDWMRMIKAVETVDENILNALTFKVLGVAPNTYTYTKSLAEQMVSEFRHSLPVVIFRPSIVVSSYKEPMFGWVDNFNGPVGIFCAGGKGVMRYVYTDPVVKSDFMPVDITIKAMVVTVWGQGNTPYRPGSELPVYNASASSNLQVTSKRLVEYAAVQGREIPTTNMLWLPRQELTSSYVEYFIGVLITHMLPALFVDLVLHLTGRKPMLMKIQRRIFVANTALSFFMFNDWTFENKRLLALETTILPGDLETWGYQTENIDGEAFMKNCFLGGRRYLLHEDDSTLPQARINYNRMWWLDRFTKTMFYCLVLWFVYTRPLVQTTLASLRNSLLSAD